MERTRLMRKWRRHSIDGVDAIEGRGAVADTTVYARGVATASTGTPRCGVLEAMHAKVAR
jgi:hypothetical protein